jgi:hypothetical protein
MVSSGISIHRFKPETFLRLVAYVESVPRACRWTAKSSPPERAAVEHCWLDTEDRVDDA